MVTTLPAQEPVTPVGRPVTVAFVAPVVAYVILVIGVLTHTVWASVPAAEVRVTVLAGVTVIRISLFGPSHPEIFLSTTRKVHVPKLVQIIEIRLLGAGPLVIVPVPPEPAIILQV